MDRLPIDDYEKLICEKISAHSSMVLSAATGSGKSTRVPQFVASVVSGQVLLLEPRRVAARAIAQRIAYEWKAVLGEAVGYHIRFENRSRRDTQIKVITEGLLLQYLQSDPLLENVSCVILDEFHERSVHTDFALACLRELQKNFRPDLKIIVMSATLDAEKICQFLDAEHVEIPGKHFPVQVLYQAPDDKRSSFKSLSDKIFDLLSVVLNREDLAGDVLIFLTGWREIENAMDQCRSLEVKHQVQFYPLHGTLSAAEQDRVFEETRKRKVIFSTNIAETSLTLPKVCVVIDSGWVRETELDLELLVSRLKVERIPFFSAEQRKGRAGRTQAGVCYRMWSKQEEEQMELAVQPEIFKTDLSLPLLQLLEWRGSALEDFVWFESPPPALLAKSLSLLRMLGALGDKGLSSLGKKMLSIPLSLRSRHLMQAPLRREDARTRLEFVAHHEALTFAQIEELQRRQQPGRGEQTFEEALVRAFPDRVGLLQDKARLTLVGNIALNFLSEKILSEKFPKTGVVWIAHQIRFSRKNHHWERHCEAAHPLDVEVLKKAFPDFVKTKTWGSWDDQRKSLKSFEALCYRDLPLEKVREMPVDPQMRAQALAQHCVENLEGFRKKFEALHRLWQRLEFYSHWFPERFSNHPTQEWVAHFEMFFTDCKSVQDLSEELLLKASQALLSHSVQGDFQRQAPEFYSLKSTAKRIPYRYEAYDRVILSARLQEFFGERNIPPLAEGKLKVLVELLAPNYRPVQITSDLEGFWVRTYPEVRKELKHRYPKHKWPEKVEFP